MTENKQRTVGAHMATLIYDTVMGNTVFEQFNTIMDRVGTCGLDGEGFCFDYDTDNRGTKRIRVQITVEDRDDGDDF